VGWRALSVRPHRHCLTGFGAVKPDVENNLKIDADT
jgi:hypothetical protein